MQSLTLKSKVKGVTTVEFSIIALLFFILVFSILEVSRLLFVWNAVADAARLGARAAAVCSVNSNDIANITLSNPSGGGNAFLPNNLTAANVQVRYLDAAGVPVAFPDPVVNPGGFMQVRYVEVSIINYQHDLLIPLLGGSITLPPFTTTRPREALGVIPVTVPPDATNQGC